MEQGVIIVMGTRMSMITNNTQRQVSEFSRFWRETKNSLSRSAILMHRLIYDLQLAAAKRGYFLEVYRSEVDQDGFDIILDDRDNMKKVQVKTVISDSRTSFWKIHKAMLRPNYLSVEELGFEPSPKGTGYQGGVVLMVLECDGLSINIDYCYTDVFILKAFDVGVVSYNHNIRNRAVKNLYRKLQEGISHDKIKVCKSAFLKTKSAGHLLALAGLHSCVGSSWPLSLLDFLRTKKLINKSVAADVLRELVCDPNIRYCSPPLKSHKHKILK